MNENQIISYCKKCQQSTYHTIGSVVELNCGGLGVNRRFNPKGEYIEAHPVGDAVRCDKCKHVAILEYHSWAKG